MREQHHRVNTKNPESFRRVAKLSLRTNPAVMREEITDKRGETAQPDERRMSEPTEDKPRCQDRIQSDRGPGRRGWDSLQKG